MCYPLVPVLQVPTTCLMNLDGVTPVAGERLSLGPGQGRTQNGLSGWPGADLGLEGPDLVCSTSTWAAAVCPSKGTVRVAVTVAQMLSSWERTTCWCPTELLPFPGGGISAMLVISWSTGHCVNLHVPLITEVHNPGASSLRLSYSKSPPHSHSLWFHHRNEMLGGFPLRCSASWGNRNLR